MHLACTEKMKYETIQKARCQAPSWPGACLDLSSVCVLTQKGWIDTTCVWCLLTWWACWSSSILSWRIWQSYSLLFLSIWRLSFSTAVRSSSCCFSVSSSPNFITVSCCKALYKVASSSWILWLMQYQKSIRDETWFEPHWELRDWWQIRAPAWEAVPVIEVHKTGKLNSENGSMFWKEDRNFYFWNVLILIFTEILHFYSFLWRYRELDRIFKSEV